MQYRSCSMIENFFLNFNGRIDAGGKCMTICCEGIANIPRTALGKTGEESIENFQYIRAKVIEESKLFSLLDRPGKGKIQKKRKYTEGCAKCANFQLGEFRNSDNLIHYVNLSMYPAPCQSRCFYCGVHSGESGKFDKNNAAVTESYEKMFDALDYAKKSGLISTDAIWQISSGEIAIHPYKDRILNLVKNQAAMFYTNCFIYDEGIAQNLSVNPRSAINLSIDSGAPETWLKIKNVDNFANVKDNLVKYFNNSARPGQITLKYIVFPGINDNLEEYSSLIEIMQRLQVKHLTISRDTRFKYKLGSEQRENLIEASARLAAMLHKNTTTFDMFTFAPSERERVIELAKKLLQTGRV